MEEKVANHKGLRLSLLIILMRHRKSGRSQKQKKHETC